MRNLLLTLRFDGSNYHGWQIQPNAVTVCGELTSAFSRLSGKNEKLIGCSRTDAGVHAQMFCVSVKTECEIPAEKIPDALNFYLPADISVYDCREMPTDFHARYDCKGKEYVYLIYNGKYRNPFYEGKALFYPYKLDEKELDRFAKSFCGEYDLSAFCSAGCEITERVRTIFSADVKRQGDLLTFTVSGNGFLYNTVRIMAGTLLDISHGKIKGEDIPLIIESKNRESAGHTAEACGLYLNKVFY